VATIGWATSDGQFIHHLILTFGISNGFDPIKSCRINALLYNNRLNPMGSHSIVLQDPVGSYSFPTDSIRSESYKIL
jgi:hypothetical protein